ncbi:MAG TPA: pilus assembly protein PilC [Elusimicrobia bacterium]|nr:MAG: pilus assembly protein PilC [Elusimicrobia bacterium RIFOXYA12_FULL_49_49]OGS15928.1 MAG: pilus assembly protein PilC [Elusimicrobia bacterium RIFOXYA2_FULL_47_53]OGS26390.1 MAG: pilus assembly protein PilC [Elusimicrobia bacterium RIFOXYB12_FULL_50_12]OGS29096.1 MAG: pilus assembly protein PilC [Elusimicrobia bacterium RIFOXYB2_FULL_46_23]HBU69177.1 pilus assembly protein PilC [Elusimicrobiota bacterium]
MPQFSYKAKLPNGGVTSAVIEAPDARSASEKLRAQKLNVLEIKEVIVNPIVALLKKINPLKPSVGSKELVLFSRQLSTLVSAGVPIVQGLTLLVDQAETPLFKKVLSQLRQDIEQGISIAESMGKHPEAFSTLYVSMIKAGELGGILDAILERLSTYLENAEELKGKVKGAMVYPAVISTVAGAVTLFLLIFVIPTFQGIFASFGAELPLPTKVLIGLSTFLRDYFLLVLATPVALFVGFKQFRKSEKGLLLTDTYALKLPLFGLLIRKVSVAKFSRTLGTLIKSGVPILQALETVSKTAGNKVVENAIATAMVSIKEGERMTPPLQKTGVFPPMVIQMIGIGEETGNLDTMLAKIADFYDQEVDVAVKGLTSMMEPLIMVGMGLVIGAIVLAMFMPMFEMSQLASK